MLKDKKKDIEKAIERLQNVIEADVAREAELKQERDGGGCTNLAEEPVDALVHKCCHSLLDKRVDCVCQWDFEQACKRIGKSHPSQTC